MEFIVHFNDGSKETYTNEYDESNKQEQDAAWNDVDMTFPDAEYIEPLI